MLIGDQTDSAGAVLSHGGDLTSARRLFPDAPEPFVDLSTGINPISYPVPVLSTDDFVRLPDRAAIGRLAAIAAQSYGACSADSVVPAPGTQVLLPMVASLIPPGRARILGPTYSEHLRAARLAGHHATEVAGIEQLKDADLAVVVNPNNPDGRVTPRAALLDIAGELRGRGGILVVDEAFADVGPENASLAGDTGRDGIVVLRSFGKFFGLAGVRLGFALTSPALARRLDAVLGPWAVSGAAIAIASRALADKVWATSTRQRLAGDCERLDRILGQSGLEIVGGTPLFRLTRSSGAQELFLKLGRAGILTRRFDYDSTWLRWGIPGNDVAWQRLEAVLLATAKA